MQQQPAVRAAIIEELAASIKYARAQKLVESVQALAPFSAAELERIVTIGEATARWEPPRITLYQDLLASSEMAEHTALAARLTKLLKSVRADLVDRLRRSNNFPTARMYMDALHRFSGFSAAQVEKIIAVKVENKRIAGMRLEPRQFLFYRELLVRHGAEISAARRTQLIEVLQSAVAEDPELATV